MDSLLTLPVTVAGIDFGNLYRDEVNPHLWGPISIGIFVVGQILAIIFLVVVLRHVLGYSHARSYRAGLGIQLVFTFIFFWVSVFSVLFAAGLAYYPAITPPAYELAWCIQSYDRGNLLLAGLATWVLLVILSYVTLRYLQVPALTSRNYSLIHATIMHPLFAPLNFILGFFAVKAIANNSA